MKFSHYAEVELHSWDSALILNILGMQILSELTKVDDFTVKNTHTGLRLPVVEKLSACFRTREASVCVRASVGSHLVGGSEFSPRFICSPVVVVGVRGLDILVETQDLPRLEFSHCGSLGQLRAEQNQQGGAFLSQARLKGHSGLT